MATTLSPHTRNSGPRRSPRAAAMAIATYITLAAVVALSLVAFSTLVLGPADALDGANDPQSIAALALQPEHGDTTVPPASESMRAPAADNDADAEPVPTF